MRVVELAGIGPAPFAAMLLADLGADVVRIDRPVPGLSWGPRGCARAQTSGQRQVVDAAIVDGTAHLATLITALSTYGSRDRGTNLIDIGAPFYDVYETADGRWMSIGALEPQFWVEAVLELEAVPGREDRERWPEIRTMLADAFRRRTQAEWSALVESVDA
jgi:alpha-methylacyl-CoA racemase